VSLSIFQDRPSPSFSIAEDLISTARKPAHTIAGKIPRMHKRERFRLGIMLEFPLIRECFTAREACAARE
jgi:hypothetical protein